MIANHDAKTKLFIVMPMTDGMGDSVGSVPIEFEFPHPCYCSIFVFRSDAEVDLLEKQKKDPEGVYLIFESIAFCERHDRMNEYSIAETIQW